MTTPQVDPPVRSAVTMSHWATAMVLSLAVTAGTMLLLHRQTVLTDTLWYDEIVTFTAATDPHPTRWLSIHWIGLDTAPPLVNSIHRLAASFWPSPGALRLLTLAVSLLAMPLAYRTLRFQFDHLPALAGMCALAASAPFQQNLIELRAYGMLCAFCAAVAALSVPMFAARPPRWPVAAGWVLAVLAAGLTHWFGFLVMGCMIGPVALLRLLDRTFDRRRLLWLLIPPALLLCLTPLLMAQGKAYGGATWVSPVRLATIWQVASAILGPGTVALVALITLAVVFFRGRFAPPATREYTPTLLLGGTLLTQAVILLISIAKPAFHERYAAVSVLAVVPLVALFAAALQHHFRLILLGGLVVLAVGVQWTRLDSKRMLYGGINFMTEQLARKYDDDRVLVFDDHLTAVTYAHRTRQRGTFWPTGGRPVRVLMLPAGDIKSQGGPDLVFEQLIQTEWNKLYPNPIPMTEDDLPDRFLLKLSLPQPYLERGRLGPWRLRWLGDQVVEATRD